MIRKLRRRFILAALLSFTIVLLLILISLNSVIIIGTNLKSEDFIDELAYSGNSSIRTMTDFLFDFSNENEYYQSVYLKNVYFKNTGMNYQEVRPTDYFTGENVEYLLKGAKGKNKGHIGNFYFKVYDMEDKVVTCFIDISKDLYFLRYFVTYSILAFIICEIIVFFLLFIFSKKAINPLVENIENQKNFIDNASHEIKTPISVIAANNEIHEMKYGENKWTLSTRRQIIRINKLIDQMLKLAKYEDREKPLLVYEKINLKDVINFSLSNMESIIINKKIIVENNISDVEIIADKTMTKDLIEIILENAIKYTLEEGKIIINTNGKSLEVSNTASPMTREETSKIFEKFYRTDKARSRETGGNGMGLAIARSICDINNLKISASYNKGFFKIKVSKTN